MRLTAASERNLGDNTAGVLLRLQIRLLHWFHLLLLWFDFVIFGSLSQVKGGIDVSSALLAEGRELKRDRLNQAVTRLQFQHRGLSWDLVEVYEAIFSLALFQSVFNESAQFEEEQLLRWFSCGARAFCLTILFAK